jgi:hypothetical protein
MKKILFVLAACFVLTACDQPRDSGTSIERRKQAEMTLRGMQEVGMPAIANFAEKRMMKDIIELRDRMQPTYTYIADMNGGFHKVCDSLGYGLPYATQYTNPQMPQQTIAGGSTYVLPQSDPNGLYSPASADGTWVMCLNPKTKKAEPQYIEPHVLVTTFPLN